VFRLSASSMEQDSPPGAARSDESGSLDSRVLARVPAHIHVFKILLPPAAVPVGFKRR